MVITPTNFLAVSNQGLVALTWNSVPLVTGYVVNRSEDNVVFAPLDIIPGLSFNDTTAVLGTLYYYQIQSTDGVDVSLPTVSLVGQALKPGQTTVGNVMLQCQQRTDRVHSDNITTQEWASMINQSYKELYDILIQKFGNDYYIAPPYSYQLTGQIDPQIQGQAFPLPDDFYKLMRVEVALNPGDPNSWVTLRQFQAIEANRYSYPNTYTYYGITNLKYRLWGNKIQILPISASGQTLRIWYSPRPNQLINQTDTLDCVSGWDEYIVIDCAIKALAKTEEDVQIFAAQKMAMLKRIEEAAENRNVSEPQRVSDSLTRSNNWWGNGGDYGGGYGNY